MRIYNKFYYICIIHKALNCLSTRFLNCLWLRERLGFMLQRQSNKHVRIKKLKERNRKKKMAFLQQYSILSDMWTILKYIFFYLHIRFLNVTFSNETSNVMKAYFLTVFMFFISVLRCYVFYVNNNLLKLCIWKTMKIDDDNFN